MKRSIFLILLSITLFFGTINPPAINAAGNQLPHYLGENSRRYEVYQARNPGMPFDIVVAYVNANVDIGGYVGIQTVQNPNDISVLLNKNFALPPGWVPNDLVPVGEGRQLRAEAAEQFNALKAAAGDLGLTFFVRSGYRSHWSQVASYDLIVQRDGRTSADRQSARPGHSEHQLGLALDLAHRAGTTGPLGNTGFSNSREFTWLVEHGHEYGFILRYPRGYTEIHGFVYEPWHWRYVGVEIATVMRRERISTFEEYYGRYLNPRVIAENMLRPIQSVVYLNGAAISFEAYSKDGGNYFKLRDLAFALNSTNKRFTVFYNDDANSITLISGLPYTAQGGEMSQGDGRSRIVAPSEVRIFFDGAEMDSTVYSIRGSIFLKLRDLMKALDVYVGYNTATKAITIDTSRGYAEEVS